MKKIALMLGFVVAGIAASTTDSFSQAVMGSKMTYKSLEVNYGDVEYAGNGERTWKFKNEGTQPLMITSATGSCGCTVPDYPKEAIPAGKEGEIKIKYDTKRTGPFSKTVTIVTNEPEGSNTHVITVKGNVKPQVSATPTQDQNGKPTN
ncbi:MAG TPA: DUF1573 domain-containing protein [Bacteroidia bacterium]